MALPCAKAGSNEKVLVCRHQGRGYDVPLRICCAILGALKLTVHNRTKPLGRPKVIQICFL
jgi:hypothetical protein